MTERDNHGDGEVRTVGGMPYEHHDRDDRGRYTDLGDANIFAVLLIWGSPFIIGALVWLVTGGAQ